MSILLRELFKRWGNHKVMVRWLSRFFNYLDRCWEELDYEKLSTPGVLGAQACNILLFQETLQQEA